MLYLLLISKLSIEKVFILTYIHFFYYTYLCKTLRKGRNRMVFKVIYP